MTSALRGEEGLEIFTFCGQAVLIGWVKCGQGKILKFLRRSYVNGPFYELKGNVRWGNCDALVPCKWFVAFQSRRRLRSGQNYFTTWKGPNTMCCRVSSCCCGCSLEEGCKISVIVGLILGFIRFSLACNTTDGVEIASNILGIVAAGLLLFGTL